MNSDSSHKALLGAILIVGIIILIILVSPRGYSSYSYNGANVFTASTYPVQTGSTVTIPVTGSYSFVRYVPKSTTRTTGSTYTYYTYPQQSSYQDTGAMFSDGCTLTSPFSLTTGQPCS